MKIHVLKFPDGHEAKQPMRSNAIPVLRRDPVKMTAHIAKGFVAHDAEVAEVMTEIAEEYFPAMWWVAEES